MQAIERTRGFGRVTVTALLAGFVLGASAPEARPAGEFDLSKKEQERRERSEKFDTQNLRAKTAFTVDRDKAFLVVPKAEFHGEFDVARTPPTVKFRILPNLEPEFFGEGVQFYQAGWANWAYAARSADNRFYLAASDHRGRGAHINLYEYRPADGVVERVLDVGSVLGWTPDTYTDGKIHGHMGIMPDGELWVATHFGPFPKTEWFEAGYRGSWLLSYNIHTREAKNWGVPLIVHDLACHTLDTERGIFLATGSYRGMMLSWDVKEKRTRFAGYPPKGWIWHPRSMLLDKATGIFWGNDNSEEPYRFLAFSPELNEFKRFDVEVPANPVTGHRAQLRGHTHEPDGEGWYYWSTMDGTLFRFRPDWDKGPEVEVLGTNWDKGRDVLQMAICPQKRYIYYQPKGEPQRGAYSPLVQYDIRTGRKKAIAFLQDYYHEKYGYTVGTQVYGVEVSNDGAFVVIVENGTFGPFGTSFGHPALTVVEIPESERRTGR